MTATQDAGPATAAQECKRPGCGNALPPGGGRGRHRVFCSDDCARRYHNDARLPAASSGAGSDGDPLAELEPLLRQAAVLARAARDQAAGLDPARVRADIADAEAARRRAEAAAVTAAARQAEAEAETQALAEALSAARDGQAAAGDSARHAEETARAFAAELDHLRRDTAEKITAAAQAVREQVTAARADAVRAQRERDEALAAARDTRTAADTETSRARQAEKDARTETGRVRDDAARERGNLREHHQAQLEAAHELTAAERARAERAEAQLEAERADRRTLTSHLTSPASDNGHPQPADGPDHRSGARSK